MLRSINELKGYVIGAQDGEVGPCRDFLFDDRDWVIRYMVARISKWLPGRKVIISPLFLQTPDWTGKRMPVRLTRKQIEACPPLDEHAPVSRRYEISYHQTYALPLYFLGNQLWDAYPDPSGTIHPGSTIPDETVYETGLSGATEGHLRSCNEVIGYHISAEDGDLGHIDDLLVDDVTWTIRSLVVHTRNWAPGRKVLLAPLWLKSVKWVDRKVNVGLDVESVKNGPVYDPARVLNHTYDINPYENYRGDRYKRRH